MQVVKAFVRRLGAPLAIASRPGRTVHSKKQRAKLVTPKCGAVEQGPLQRRMSLVKRDFRAAKINDIVGRIARIS